MKKKGIAEKYLGIFVVVFLLIILVWQLIPIYENNNFNLKSNIDLIDEATTYFKEDVNGIQIDLMISGFCYDDIGIELKDLIVSDPLFVRYSINSCGKCIKKLIDELQTYATNNKDKEIIFLINGMSNRELYINWITNNKKFKMIRMDMFPMDEILETYDPYLFKLDSFGRITSHFICQYEDTINLKNFLHQL